MKNRPIILLFSLFFLGLVNQGLTQEEEYVQQLLDSLKKVDSPKKIAKIHDDLGYYFSSIDSTKAVYHTRIALNIAQEHQILKQIGNSYTNLGVIQGHFQHQQAAINYHDSAYYYFALAKDTSGLIAALSNSGRRYCYLGNCEEGIRKYQLAEKWVKPNNVKKTLVIRINHALCLMECRAYEECLSISEKAIKQAIEIDNSLYQFHFYYLMGNSLTSLNRNEEALIQWKKAQQLAVKLEDLDLEAHVLNGRSSAYLQLGKYQQAYDNAHKSMKMKELHGVMVNDYRVYLNVAEAAKKLGELEESIKYFEIGLQGSEVTEDNVIIADSYEMAAEAYYLAGKNKQAYEHMQRAKVLRDTIFTNEMRQNLQTLTTKYETEKIKQELTSSKLRIEQEQNRNRLTLFGGLSLLGLFGVVYLFFLGRQRRRRLETEKRKIELEYGLLRAQMNPHFIFNSLNSIQGFFAENDFAQGNEFLGKFSRLVRRVLDQSVAPAILVSEELETLKLYLDVEKIRLKDNLFYTIQVDENVESDLINVPPLILQPFVENAIWHGIAPKNEAGTIDISLKMSEKEDFLLVVIEDDGVGVKTEKGGNAKMHESKGIQITKERLGINGQVKVTNKENAGNSGVKVELKIPLIDYD